MRVIRGRSVLVWWGRHVTKQCAKWSVSVASQGVWADAGRLQERERAAEEADDGRGEEREELVLGRAGRALRGEALEEGAEDEEGEGVEVVCRGVRQRAVAHPVVQDAGWEELDVVC